MASVADELKKFADLHSLGLISDEELANAKRALLEQLSGASKGGRSSRAASDDPKPDSVGGYKILGEIGRGGMGVVYRARNRISSMAQRQGGDVALKLMSSVFAQDASYRARFEKEANVGMELDHPNIVRVVDFVEDGGRLALVMEFVEGCSLKDLLRQRPPWPQSLPRFEGVVDAIRCAHEHEVLHRDIKPANILVSDKGPWKVLDFGLAKNLDAKADMGLTTSRQGLGTDAYMAPEQAMSARTADERADIFSLGLVLYELLTGPYPWGDLESHYELMDFKKQERLVRRRPPPGGVHPDLLDVAWRACRASPDDRFDSVTALQTSLSLTLRRATLEARLGRSVVLNDSGRSTREAEDRLAAETKARRDAEEKAKREAEARANREAKAKREAEQKARREAEAKARREAEQKARREAEAKARREAEAKAKREAEENARREAEAKAKREAEVKARREAEAKARREAEEKAKREAEEKAKREAEQKARREAEARARREAEERARREAEAKAMAEREAEETARREAEAKAKREAEERARREAEARAKREAEENARREAEAKAKREAEEKAEREAEARAQRDAKEKAQREAQRRFEAAWSSNEAPIDAQKPSQASSPPAEPTLTNEERVAIAKQLAAQAARNASPPAGQGTDTPASIPSPPPPPRPPSRLSERAPTDRSRASLPSKSSPTVQPRPTPEPISPRPRSPASSEAPDAPRKRRPWFLIIAGTAAGVCALICCGGSSLSMCAGDDPAPEVAPAAPTTPEPVEPPEDTAPPAEPEQIPSPSTSGVVQQSASTSTPSAKSSAVPASTTTAKTVSKPAAGSSGPAPSEPEVAKATTGTVVIQGEVAQARLRSTDGTLHAPGSLATGTYDLAVEFPGGTRILLEGHVTVEAGKTITIRCDAVAQNCR